MTHTWKDAVATALVAAVVVIYLAYLAFEGIPFVRDVRGMAAVALIASIASRRIGGREGFPHRRAAIVANFASIGLGVAALVSGLAVVLGVFVFSIVTLWLAAMVVAADDEFGAHRMRPSPG